MQNGGANTVVFSIQNADGSPYNITGLTWEYVVRRDASDAFTASVIELTSTPNAQGVVTPNVTDSTVTVTLYPAATLPFPPRAVYAHALWSDPGDAESATNWLYGSFIINQVAQP